MATWFLGICAKKVGKDVKYEKSCRICFSIYASLLLTFLRLETASREAWVRCWSHPSRYGELVLDEGFWGCKQLLFSPEVSLHMQPPNIHQTWATFEGFGCKKKLKSSSSADLSKNKGLTADLCLSKGERGFISKPLLFSPLMTKTRLKVWANLAWFWHCFVPAGRQTQQANKKTCFDVPF